MKTILYAEDDENDVFFMKRALAKNHVKLQVVTNGKEALEFLLGEGAVTDRKVFPKPDVLILDIKMPHLTGLDVLKWIREHTELNDLPVVMLSSSTHENDIAFCREKNAQGYFVKPSRACELEEITTAILSALDQDQNKAGHFPVKGNRLEP